MDGDCGRTSPISRSTTHRWYATPMEHGAEIVSVRRRQSPTYMRVAVLLYVILALTSAACFATSASAQTREVSLVGASSFVSVLSSTAAALAAEGGPADATISLVADPSSSGPLRFGFGDLALTGHEITVFGNGLSLQVSCSVPFDPDAMTLSAGKLTIVDVTVVGCSGANGDPALAGQFGRLITINDGASLTVARTVFEAHECIFLVRGSGALAIKDSTIRDVVGPLFADSAFNDYTLSSFSGAVVYGLGTSLNAKIDISGSKISQVESQKTGGFFRLERADMTVSGTSFSSGGTTSTSGGFGGFFFAVSGGLLSASASTVSFQNSTFTDIHSMEGALLKLESVSEATFTNCTVRSIRGSVSGGLVSAVSSRVTLSQCTVSDVSVTSFVGIPDSGIARVDAGSDLNVVDSSFTEITAGNAAFAYVSGSTVRISGSQLSDFSATSTVEGTGGLFLAYGSISGAGPATVNMVSCTVARVSARVGGIAYLMTQGYSSDVSLLNSTFTDVSVDRGGIFAVVLPKALPFGNPNFLQDTPTTGTVTGSVIRRVSARLDGGAFFIEGGKHTLAVTDTEFDAVSAVNSGGIVSQRSSGGGGCGAGATTQLTPPTITIANSRINNADALDGGVYYGSAALTVTGSTFTNLSSSDWNVAAVHLTESEFCVLDVSDSVFADVKGTVLQLDDRTSATMTRVAFSRVRGARGGIVYASSFSNTTMNECTFSSISVLGSGAVIYGADDSLIYATKCSFENTSATVGGGIALLGYRSRLFLDNSVVANVSGASGGSFSIIDQGELHVDATTVAQTTASNGGFAYLRDDARMYLSKGALSGASATGSGGVFRLSGRSSVVVDNSAFADIRGALSGGFASLDELSSLLVKNTNATSVSGGFLSAGSRSQATLELTRLFMVSTNGNGAFADVSGGAQVNVTSCHVRRSTARGSGGVFNCFGGQLDVSWSTFADVASLSSGSVASLDAACRMHITDTEIANVTLLEQSHGGRGGAFLVANARSDLSLIGVGISDISVDSRVGGVVAAFDGATVLLSSVVVSNASAGDGGSIYLSNGARCRVQNVTVTGSKSSGKGGCVYAGNEAHVVFDGARFETCEANTGGSIYAESTATVLSASLTINGTNAIHGPGIYLESPESPSIGNVTFVGGAGAIDATQLPPGWVRGGLIATGLRSLDVPSGLVARSGALLPTFSVAVLDALRQRISLPLGAPLAIALSLKPVADGGNTTNAKLAGDVERNFGTGTTVLFSSLRLYARPGAYALSISSSNPLLYGAGDQDAARKRVLESSIIPVNVTDCSSGSALIYGPISTGDLESVWHCEVIVESAVVSVSSDNTSKIVPAIVIPCIVGIVVLVVVLRWQTMMARRRRSKEAHRRFLEDHMAQQGGDERPTELSREDVELHERLGEGEFGVVQKARATIGGRPRICAAKTLKEGSTYEQRVEFIKEAEIMHGLVHMNIVSLIGVCTAVEPVLIVLEYVPHGSLLSFVRAIPDKNRSTSATRAMFAQFVLQICEGMAYLASMRVVHRDLAARNVMVGQDAFGEYVMKVADFGMSKDVGEKDYFRVAGTEKVPVKWLAPESLSTRVFTEASDVWSFGVVCWELYSFGQVPFAGIPMADMRSLIARGDRLAKPSLCLDTTYAHLLACWEYEAADRPRFSLLASLLQQSASDYDGGKLGKPLPTMPKSTGSYANLPMAQDSVYDNGPHLAGTDAPTGKGEFLKAATKGLAPPAKNGSYASLTGHKFVSALEPDAARETAYANDGIAAAPVGKNHPDSSDSQLHSSSRGTMSRLSQLKSSYISLSLGDVRAGSKKGVAAANQSLYDPDAGIELEGVTIGHAYESAI